MKVTDFKLKKDQQRKITMLTCYDYPSARLIAESKIDCALVGDSVAMVMHGYESTVMATMDMMVLHTSAVAKGLGKQFLVSDLPFLQHRGSKTKTMSNVARLIQGGAHAIKIEGADLQTCETISAIVEAGVPVMGHIGLTPQSIHKLGGYKVQGTNAEEVALLKQQAQALVLAGCFAVVLECIPHVIATMISSAIPIPTIGIGAGAGTDGQVLVWHDLMGLQTDFKPKFLKQYLEGKSLLLSAINSYVEQVERKQFPAPEHCF